MLVSGLAVVGIVDGVFTRFGGTFTGVVNGVGYCVRGVAVAAGFTGVALDDTADTLTPLDEAVFKGLGVALWIAGVVVVVVGGGKVLGVVVWAAAGPPEPLLGEGLVVEMGTVTGRMAV